MAMGTEGMKYSLVVSREVIADCIETRVGGQWMDGGWSRSAGATRTCPADDGHPARQRAGDLRLRRDDPSGRYKDTDPNIVSVFEAVGQFSAGKMSEEDFCQIERRAIPGTGSVRWHVHRQHDEQRRSALGMSLPYQRARWRTWKTRSSARAARPPRASSKAVKADLKPRDIVTRKSIENAVAVIMATGGFDQRGAALPGHRPRRWRRVDHRRLRAYAARCPCCATKPSGQVPGGRPLHRAGGIPQVMKILLDAGCCTATA